MGLDICTRPARAVRDAALQATGRVGRLTRACAENSRADGGRRSKSGSMLGPGRASARRHARDRNRRRAALPHGRDRRARVRLARARRAGGRSGPRRRPHAGAAAARAGSDHVRAAEPRGGGAAWARFPGSVAAPARHGRRQPGAAGLRQALRARAGRARRRADAGGRDGGSGERRRDRRRRDPDRDERPRGGRDARRHPLGDRADGPAGQRRRRGGHGGAHEPRGGRDHRPRRGGDRDADRQARQLAALTGGRTGRVRHPLRARGARDARAAAGRRRLARDRADPGADGRRRHLADQDHVRAGHLRAAGAAGRALRPDDRRPADRHPRRDAAQRSRRVGGDARAGPLQRADRA